MCPNKIQGFSWLCTDVDFHLKYTINESRVKVFTCDEDVRHYLVLLSLLLPTCSLTVDPVTSTILVPHCPLPLTCILHLADACF